MARIIPEDAETVFGTITRILTGPTYDVLPDGHKYELRGLKSTGDRIFGVDERVLISIPKDRAIEGVIIGDANFSAPTITQYVF